MYARERKKKIKENKTCKKWPPIFVHKNTSLILNEFMEEYFILGGYTVLNMYENT